jgi:hypothetical protein
MILVPFGNTMVSRRAPLMPAQNYRTFAWKRPRATHYRAATCEEVDCEAMRFGWVTTLDDSTEEGQRLIDQCRRDRSRSFHEQRVGEHLVKFVYKPGNRCFRWQQHKVLNGRPPTFLVAGGDFRGNPRQIPTRVHTRAEDWVDDFANHEGKLADLRKKG